MEEIKLSIAMLPLFLLVASLSVFAAPADEVTTKDITGRGYSPETQDRSIDRGASTVQPLKGEVVNATLTGTAELSMYGLSTTERTLASGPGDQSSNRNPAVCPSFCECANLEMHCSRAKLDMVPNDLDTGTTYLDLGHNQITALSDDELASRGLIHLTSLILDNNKISTVSQHAFRGLSKLSLLQLAGNLIEHLHPNIFQGNVELKHVDLTGNPLTFSTEGPIFYTKSLEWVDLDQCNLTNLPTEAFHDMPSLRYINLNGNQIRKLQLSQFSKMGYLRYVKLLGNPLQCDCDMKPLWRWFTQQSINADGRCVAPSNGSESLRKYFESLECKK